MDLKTVVFCVMKVLIYVGYMTFCSFISAVHHLTSLLANLSTPYQRSSANKTLESLEKDNTTLTSPQYPNYRPQPFNLPHSGMAVNDKNKAPPPTPEMSPLPNFPIPSPELFGQTLVRCLERMSAIGRL